MGGRSVRADRIFAQRRSRAPQPRDGRHFRRPRARRDRGDRRHPGSSSRPENASARTVEVMRFNLSEWALNHRSIVVYCMIAVTVAGVMSYLRLGRNEDPAFTFRAMVVQAAWRGANLEDTLNQVRERMERTLKETPNLDILLSFK